MAEQLFNRIQVSTTYRTNEEVQNFYLNFGEPTNALQQPNLDNALISAFATYLLDLYQALAPFFPVDWLVYGYDLLLPNMTKTRLPPYRNMVRIQGTNGDAALPGDSNYRVEFLSTRPDNKFARGGLYLSPVAENNSNSGSLLSIVVDDFNNTVAPKFLAPIVISGTEYRLGILGQYTDLNDVPQDYFVEATIARLASLVSGRKDRIPNRRNYPRGTCKGNIGVDQLGQPMVRTRAKKSVEDNTHYPATNIGPAPQNSADP